MRRETPNATAVLDRPAATASSSAVSPDVLENGLWLQAFPGRLRQRLPRMVEAYAAHAPRWAMIRLLLHVRHEAPDLVDGGHLNALFRLAICADRWLRPLTEWRRPEGDARAQFGSLARHLLADYPLPAFLDAVFHGPGMLGYPDWFARLGRGADFRDAEGMTAPLTRRMVHHFLLAPGYLSPVGAVRWAQVAGLGGSPDLFREVGNTDLGRALRTREEEEWWHTVLHWLARHAEMEIRHVRPVIDYVQSRAYHQGEFLGAEAFRMEGRTPASLLRRVEAWHEELGRARTEREMSVTWEPCGISGSRWEAGVEVGGSPWTVRELLTARELWEEGEAMSHCVYSYAYWCASRRSAIFSLRRGQGETAGRAVTAEVQLSSWAIVQARGPSNRLPDLEERRALKQWAREHGLHLRL